MKRTLIRMFKAPMLAILVLLGFAQMAHGAVALTVAPTSLSWFSVAVGTEGGPKSVTLTNNGTTTATLSNIAVTGAKAADFLITANTCGNSLGASASCTVTVRFAPSVAATESASLIFTDSDPNSPQTVALSGTGSGSSSGSLSVSPSSLSWGSVAVGSAGGAKSVTLTNSGSSAVSLSSVAVSGTNAGDFTISSNGCGSSLAASASCTVTLLFQPSASGTRTATLTFTDSASNSPQTVALSGTGTGGSSGNLSVSPSSAAFGSVAVGSPGSAIEETVTNGTSSAISISSVAVSGTNAGDFTIPVNTCGSSVAASSSCSVTVLFKPAASGSRTATLTFTDAAANSPQTVALSGTGTSSVTVSPSSLAFGSVAVGSAGSALQETLTNGTSSAISISSVSVSGTNAGDFTIPVNTCGSTLEASESCTIIVLFKPAASGSRTATLNFTDSASNSPQTVPLSGTGTSSGSVTVSPTSLSFGSVVVGSGGSSLTTTLSNGTSSAISISSIAVSGANPADFTLSSNSCGSSLAASSSCTVTVLFQPSGSGSRSATLTFTDSANSSPQTVALSGTGTSGSGSLTVSPSSLSWFSVSVGTAGGAKSVTLTNNGSSSVSLSSIAVTGTDSSEFVITSNSCGSSLAASANCTVSIKFEPLASGTRTASLTITDSASNSPQTVALSGTGTGTGTVTVSPTALAFGSVAEGSGSSLTAILTNGTSSSVTISSIAVSGTNAGDFTLVSNGCGSSVASGANCTVTVLFQPSATGARKATLTFTDSAGNSPQKVALTGTGTSGTGSVTVSPSSLAFGSVAVGSSGSSLTETLTNGTSSTVTINSIAVSGNNAGDFTVSSTSCGTSLSASASCTVTVLFQPSASGSRTATLTFTDSASNSPQTVPLSGTGTSSGSVTVSPTSLLFGSVNEGTSSSLSTTLTNGTSSSISISSIAVSGTNAADYTISGSSCGSSLAASANCTVTVLFQPSATGSRTATLKFSDSANNSPQTVALTGTGASGTPTGNVTATPSSLVWGTLSVGASGADQTVTLHNTGSTTVSISSIALTSTDPGDFSIDGKTCGGSLGAGASCTVNVSFSPNADGTRVALLSFTDAGTGSPQTVELSGTGGPISSQSPSITVDFGSRSGGMTVAPDMLAVEYIDSLPDAASRNTVVQAGIRTSRLHANVTSVYATPTPNWAKIDGIMRTYEAAGVHPILIIDTTPPWLVPSNPQCKGATDTNVPSDLTKWGEMAASYVQHLDANFPGLVTDYEVWNEPNNTGALCSSNKLADYLDIYAAAAPLMKAQAKADGATVRVGGPASAGVAWPTLLTDSRTAPYVDFYSYHLYLSTGTQIHQGMTWDGAGGTPSLYQLILNGTAGEAARYKEALSYVKAGNTPLGAKMPVYFSEYNDNYAFEADCCRNDPTYSPLFNSMAIAEILNTAYSGASQLPTKMVYYSAAQQPFCIMGVPNAAMDCTPASSNAGLIPYPQLYTFKLISAPGYLDLVDGGHMASSVTLSSAAKSQGLIATAYYTPTTDSILIINPTSSSFSGVSVSATNPGFSSSNATLFTLNYENRRVSTWPASLVSVGGGVQAEFDVPAHSVLAISLKSN